METAKDGDEALKRIRKQRPDLILLDLLMPRRDGFSVLAEVKKHPTWASIPIIVLTNLGSDAKMAAEALTHGAFDVLVKTDWKLADVVRKVRERLGGGF